MQEIRNQELQELIEETHEETKEENAENEQNEESKAETDSDPELEYDIVEKVLSNRLKPDLLNREIVLKDCIKSYTSISALNEESLIDINIQNLLANCTSQLIFKYFLQRAAIWSIKSKELVLLLQKYISLSREANKDFVFDLTDRYPFMTQKQLNLIAESIPELAKKKTFVAQLFTKEFRKETSGKDTLAISALERMLVWCGERKKLLSQHQSLVFSITYQLVHTKLEQKVYDFDNFVYVLKNCEFDFPQFSKPHKKYIKSQKFYSDSSWYVVSGIRPDDWNEENLIKDMLIEYYYRKNNSALAPYDQYFEQTFLKKLQAEAFLKRGDSNLNEISEMFTKSELTELYNKKVLSMY